MVTDTTAVDETATETPDAGNEIKRPALVDLVVAQSGMKKKDVKPVVEATLAVLGQALSEGKDLNLAPLGKLKVTRTKDLANGTVMTLRLRRSSQVMAQAEGLETPAEDG